MNAATVLSIATNSEVFSALEAWVEQGWIRRLDAAFARFIASLSPELDAAAVVGIALLAHLEGKGHSCLDLRGGTQSLAELGLEPELANALAAFDFMTQQAWEQVLRKCRAIFVAGAAHDERQPLVLSEGRLYLRRYWDFERRVASQVRSRTAAHPAVDLALARQWLDRLFPGHGTTGDPDWQKIACAVALRGRFCVITGGPGTGKTYTAARLLALLFGMAREPAQLRVALAAPTGKAAARLKQAIEGALESLSSEFKEALPTEPLKKGIASARTLHALLGARPDTRRLRYHAGNPLDVDVLLVDEASMVHLEMMADLLDAVPDTARIVLLGDKDQLASVEAGAVLADLCVDAARGRYREATARDLEQATGMSPPNGTRDPEGPDLAQHVVMLRKSERFGGVIGQLALAINAGDASAAHGLFARGSSVEWIEQANARAVPDLAVHGRAGAPNSGFSGYLDLLRRGPRDEGSREAWILEVLRAFDEFRVLCAVRQGPWGVGELNQAIERALDAQGLLAARGEWYAGRPVMVTRNEHDLGVFNGDVGIAIRSGPGNAPLRVYFAQGSQLRSVSISRLASVETAFAMTVHKSQGSEFNHTVLVLPGTGGGVTRELVYTGVTRARSALTIVTERPQALADGIARVTRRNSGLVDRLQTAESTACEPAAGGGGAR